MVIRSKCAVKITSKFLNRRLYCILYNVGTKLAAIADCVHKFPKDQGPIDVTSRSSEVDSLRKEQHELRRKTANLAIGPRVRAELSRSRERLSSRNCKSRSHNQRQEGRTRLKYSAGTAQNSPTKHSSALNQATGRRKTNISVAI
ncbi:hypothetical protein K0M31_006767 [Melipona bicolor]|uniref:Uncharacterized protein n=1 Tax=Melipona bicolor TaxID=60889 RepID=A0AA40FSU6_9HYME|nr:hypothetical protein K0M31_006767 [Melipona bicolor]